MNFACISQINADSAPKFRLNPLLMPVILPKLFLITGHFFDSKQDSAKNGAKNGIRALTPCIFTRISHIFFDIYSALIIIFSDATYI